MTSLSVGYEGGGGSSTLLNFLGIIFCLVLIGTSSSVLLAKLEEATIPLPVEPGANVIETTHAVKKHGADAEQIRKCLRDNGASSIWQTRSPFHGKKMFRNCQLPDGRIGTQIVRWSWASMAWREVTSFVIKDGKAGQVIEYLSGKATFVR
jgi:hypothetical protein